MRRALAAVLLAAAPAAQAVAPTGALRATILDAIRPDATKVAGQPVRIKVGTFNVDRGWALLIGELVRPDGGEVDWSKSEDCDNGLDKSFFVIAHEVAGKWVVRNMEACYGDPPWEQPTYYDGLDLPCGIYDGVGSIYTDKPKDLCLDHQRRGAAARRNGR
jgi:hypothetical protein